MHETLSVRLMQRFEGKALHGEGIAERLRAVREKLGFQRQEDFASKLDRSRNSISAYERGKAVPDGETLLRLAALGVSIQWLLTGEGEMLQGEGDRRGATETQGFRPTDPDLMGRIIDTIRAVHKARGWHVSDRALGERAARWYDEIVNAAADPADRLDLLAQLQLDLGKELRRADADPACSKRPA